MIKLNDISIRNKLIIMLVFISVTVLGIFFLVFIVTDIRAYKLRKADNMINLAQLIGTNNISTLEFRDNEAANEILLESGNVSPEIVNAVILDEKGRLFASYTKPGYDTFDMSFMWMEKKSQFSNRHLIVNNDIVNKNQIVGKVFLEVELSELREMKKANYELALILMIAALGFSFLLAIAIQNYISRRLLKLVSTMKEVSKTGNYNRTIADEGKDEISVLINVFNNLMEQVKANQQKKDEFISIASHELKTPLTSIKGYMELLNEIEDRQPNKQFLQKSLNNVGKLEKLIRDLLDVSKIQRGQLELDKKEFNIDVLLDETIASIQMVTASHEIIRQNTLQNEKIFADRHRIEQVVSNLLSNAIKYSPGQKKVIVDSRKTEKEVIIKIKDFGMGVPKEEQSNIFERFYRTKDMSMTITGFGLGLYICKDIIERHNGKIWVETEEKGSAFYFSLPLKNGKSK